MTFGEQLIEILPDDNDQVKRTKTLCAELATLLEEEYRARNLGSMPIKNMLYEQALGHVLTAELSIVKLLNIK